MSKLFKSGGYFASVVLIVFGLGATVAGGLGFFEVRDTIAAENITATDDAAELEELGVNLEPGQEIRTGAEAKEFAKIIRSHVLASTGGRTYSEMGRFMTDDGGDTSNPEEAALDEDGNPVPNRARDQWVTATALTTALNTAFMAERVALFSVVMGIALLLTGIGFAVLTSGAIRTAGNEAASPKVASPANHTVAA